MESETSSVEEIPSLSNLIINNNSTLIPQQEYNTRSETEQQRQPVKPTNTTKNVVVKTLNVPTIDISDSIPATSIIDQMVRASQEWGMFQIVNHGIPPEIISRLQKAGQDFFELPQEEKEKVVGKEEGSVQGYGRRKQHQMVEEELEGEEKKNQSWVDSLFHLVWPPSVIDYKFWPKNPVYYREANEEYCNHLRPVSHNLMRYLSLGLGLEENDMFESFGGDDLEYMMKINYYPPTCSHPDDDVAVLGVTPHTDLSTLTILVPNEVPGLQVYRDGDGVWYDVEYVRNALIVHIGDQIEILSNGKYKAVMHRTTVNKDKVRMSWPVFLEPPSEKEIGPHPKLLADNKTDVDVDDDENNKKENPAAPKYKTKKFGDYRYCKLNKLPQ